MTLMTEDEAVALIDRLVGAIINDSPVPYLLRDEETGEVGDVPGHMDDCRGTVMALTICNPFALEAGNRIERALGRGIDQ